MAALTQATVGAAPVGPPRRRGGLVPLILLAPALVWLVVFFILPTISLASQSLQTGDIDNGYTLTWNFATYVDALSRYWPQFLRSIIYAASATLGTLLLGYPLAWFIAHRSGRHKTTLLVLVVAPFFTNFLIRTLAWQIILTDGGPVAGFFRATGLTTVLQAVGLTDNDSLLYSQFAVICGLVYNFLPFMVLPLYTSLERLDTRLLDAAGDLYANGWNTFWKVIWPLSLPGVVSGTLLTFIPAAGDYINSKLLGNTQTVMIGQIIDSQFLRVLDYPIAAALSFILMAAIITLVAVYVRAAGTEELV
ncbi:MAG: ABC transporter permease [Propionibacteriaceae bacterium]|nr:ABC transporter permease [Propionibacteriaceae bacterium]